MYSSWSFYLFVSGIFRGQLTFFSASGFGFLVLLFWIVYTHKYATYEGTCSTLYMYTVHVYTFFCTSAWICMYMYICTCTCVSHPWIHEKRTCTCTSCVRHFLYMYTCTFVLSFASTHDNHKQLNRSSCIHVHEVDMFSVHVHTGTCVVRNLIFQACHIVHVWYIVHDVNVKLRIHFNSKIVMII